MERFKFRVSLKKGRNDFVDLTQGLGNVRHLYSKRTGEHLYNGVLYTKKEWERKYIND